MYLAINRDRLYRPTGKTKDEARERAASRFKCDPLDVIILIDMSEKTTKQLRRDMIIW